ncbi:hypothetical protein [Dyadobacter sp. 3J3]|uniref:hypothetical protein n=1 Tax=Dyadobacter sp. 3J3 TaxID=2606600 RepID=UPI001359F92C|nr:hypothetical protein [Dyadobacter sp. 3J3]
MLQPSEKQRSSDYGPIKDLPGELLSSIESVFKTYPDQSLDLVYKTVIELIKMLHGKCPMRTEVDQTFMRDLLAPLNKQLAKANKKLYEAFQIGDLTKGKN